MTCQIAKVATRSENFSRPFALFQNARSAFRSFLQTVDFGSDEIILLPSYIGWSAREGSGVFDPVSQLGLSCRFYRMDERLQIDLADLERMLRSTKVKVLVIIHYFGYVDAGYQEAVKLARENGALVLEDEAHALYSDLVGGVCGRLGDAAIFSLHKMLPTRTGGMLIANTSCPLRSARVEDISDSEPSPWNYDLATIASQRRRNAIELSEILVELANDLELLWPVIADGIVPQTLPVIIRRVSRNRLYQLLNDEGFGVVSLYHTLIPQIASAEFQNSHRLAGRIMNLPVHQDVCSDDLRLMASALTRHVRMMS